MVGLWSISSCTTSVKPTEILVQDSIRHYYPLVQGTDLTLSWRVANVGDRPLVITDVQPSCGCIVEDEGEERVVAPGKETVLRFTFRSEKNTGYVRHTVRMFGNMGEEGMACMTFDLHVIPPALGSPDYEEVHKNRSAQDDLTTGANVKSDRGKRDYWVNAKEYAKGYNNAHWQEK